jgi:hypothetical protein
VRTEEEKRGGRGSAEGEVCHEEVSSQGRVEGEEEGSEEGSR